MYILHTLYIDLELYSRAKPGEMPDWSTVLLGLITQWLNPLREFLAPSFSPQLESAAPLLALQLY